MGVCYCSMFCCTLLYVHSSIAIILMGKRELIALLKLSSWCLVMFERLFLAVPRGCLQFVIVVFPDHTHLLFLWFVLYYTTYKKVCMSYLPRDSSCFGGKGGISKANIVCLLSLLCVKFSYVPSKELKLPTWICVYVCLQSALF